MQKTHQRDCAAGGQGAQDRQVSADRSHCGTESGSTTTIIALVRSSRYQALPSTGPLAANVNLDLGSFTQRIGHTHGTVYCYVVATVRFADGRFVQTSTAPNFQGGLITLCTCKHQMRAGKPASEWPGFWVAGVTGVAEGPQGLERGNYLVYLMRVQQAFSSHRDLWEWLAEHAPAAARMKRTDKNPLGDVYVPIQAVGDPYLPGAYLPPCPDHRHQPTAWRQDIDYVGYGHRPALLVGDPHESFLWSEPLIPLPFSVGRGCRIQTLDELLPTLRGVVVP
jgi:putative DNA base modification enzyme with NMAD domain